MKPIDKHKVLLIALCSAIAVYTQASYAQDNGVDFDEITINVVDKISDRSANVNHGHRSARRQIILDYMLENGDITQEQLDERRARRETIRTELKALRKSGDSEVLEARIAELKSERAERRRALRDYVEANQDLAESLRARRENLLERRRERRERRGNTE